MCVGMRVQNICSQYYLDDLLGINMKIFTGQNNLFKI